MRSEPGCTRRTTTTQRGAWCANRDPTRVSPTATRSEPSTRSAERSASATTTGAARRSQLEPRLRRPDHDAHGHARPLAVPHRGRRWQSAPRDRSVARRHDAIRLRLDRSPQPHPGRHRRRVDRRLRRARVSHALVGCGRWSLDLHAQFARRDRRVDRRKGRSFTAGYDELGRRVSRTELEGTSTWTWGSSAASRNIGRLQSKAGPGYSESLTYDGSVASARARSGRTRATSTTTRTTRSARSTR